MRIRASATAGPAEAESGGGGDGGTAFVTVGTTKFDALVAAVDDPRVAAALVARGFRRLVMQARRGARPCASMPHLSQIMPLCIRCAACCWTCCWDGMGCSTTPSSHGKLGTRGFFLPHTASAALTWSSGL